MTLRAWIVLGVLISTSTACGYTSEPPGGDGDGDVDADADADGDGDADCSADPEGVSCPCTEPVVCYSGPEETAGVGDCRAGLRRCEGDLGFGHCEGQVLPRDEVCNQIDDDCDGVVDDGVASACGDCNPECVADCVGVGCASEFGEGEEGGLVRDPDGALTLGDTASPQHHLIWVSNSTEGTVSKIDTRTREELGRYRTGETAYPSPSRTTVNLVGDMVVGNREEGSATKILARDCVDRNGDGLHTSGGGDDVLAWGEDDCVAWKVDGIPAARGSAFEIRPGLDGGVTEVVWVASYPFANGPVFEIDSFEGEMTGRQVDDVGGYGAALGPGGLLWVIGLGGCPTSIDTTTLERTDYGCPPGGGGYGITVDARGRVWIGSNVARLDPETEEWEMPLEDVWGGGIAVDLEGNAWVGEYGAAYKIDGETMEATAIPGAGGHGWAVDFDGLVWSIDLVDSAHVVDPETLEVEDVTPPFVGPYTYSDMTGFQLQSVTPAAGTYRETFEGCPAGTPTTWANFEWIGEAPAGTHIGFRIRTGDSIEALEGATWIRLGDASPQSIGDALDQAAVAPGRYLEIEISMTKDEGLGRPRLESFTVQHSC